MRNHEATVERYRASGKVDWGHFLPLAVLVLVVSAALAFGLHFAHRHGFYYVVLVPQLVALVVACFELLAISSAPLPKFPGGTAPDSKYRGGVDSATWT